MISKKEFEEMIGRSDFKKVLQNSSKESIRKYLGDEVANMVGYDQNNPNHHLDLFNHTLEVMDSLPKDKYLPEDYKTLKVAAFFHDIGKPHVAKEKNGKTTYINHATESREVALPILQELGYSEEEIQRIGFFIKHHDDFLNISSIDDKTVEKVSKVIERMKTEDYEPSEKDQTMLLDLCKADVTAQSEIVEENGEVKDTRANRVARYNSIQSMLPEARVYKQVKGIDDKKAKLQKRLSGYTDEPKPIEKKGRVVNQKQLDNWKEWMSKPEEERKAIIDEIKAQIASLQAQKDKILESISKNRE